MAELLRTTSRPRGAVWPMARKGPPATTPALLSWLQCFGKYACVFSEKFPEKNRELWAYMIFLIRESRRYNGEGWRDYDSMFRQQAASAADLEWSKVNNSLFSVTFLPQGSGRGKACKFCQETDHGPDVCALAPSLGETAGGEKKPASRDRWSWRPKAERVYYSWNEGRCVYHPYCRFRHFGALFELALLARREVAFDTGIYPMQSCQNLPSIL